MTDFSSLIIFSHLGKELDPCAAFDGISLTAYLFACNISPDSVSRLSSILCVSLNGTALRLAYSLLWDEAVLQNRQRAACLWLFKFARKLRNFTGVWTAKRWFRTSRMKRNFEHSCRYINIINRGLSESECITCITLNTPPMYMYIWILFGN